MSGHSKQPSGWAIGVHAPEHPHEAAVLAADTLLLFSLVSHVMGATSDPARLRALRRVEHHVSHLVQSITDLHVLLAPKTRPSRTAGGKAASDE